MRPDIARLRRVAPPAHVATWLKVIQRLVAELQPHDRAAAISLVRAMLQGATAVGVDPVARELVRLALEGKINERLYHVTEGHVHALLNFAYVHAATAVGPVLADRILSAAITRGGCDARGGALRAAQAAVGAGLVQATAVCTGAATREQPRSRRHD